MGLTFLPSNPKLDVSKFLVTTQLFSNPLVIAKDQIFIGVKGIKIDGQVLKFNSPLFGFNKRGFGRTKISNVDPYTKLQKHQITRWLLITNL